MMRTFRDTTTGQTYDVEAGPDGRDPAIVYQPRGEHAPIKRALIGGHISAAPRLVTQLATKERGAEIANGNSEEIDEAWLDRLYREAAQAIVEQ